MLISVCLVVARRVIVHVPRATFTPHRTWKLHRGTNIRVLPWMDDRSIFFRLHGSQRYHDLTTPRYVSFALPLTWKSRAGWPFSYHPCLSHARGRRHESPPSRTVRSEAICPGRASPQESLITWRGNLPTPKEAARRLSARATGCHCLRPQLCTTPVSSPGPTLPCPEAGRATFRTLRLLDCHSPAAKMEGSQRQAR